LHLFRRERRHPVYGKTRPSPAEYLLGRAVATAKKRHLYAVFEVKQNLGAKRNPKSKDRQRYETVSFFEADQRPEYLFDVYKSALGLITLRYS
jgi:hypothetical protein